MSKSTYAINAALNVFLRDTAYTTPTTVYTALFNGSPASGGTEASGGSYARQSTAFSAPSAGTTSNSAALTFSNMPAITITYIGIYDAVTAGNLLYYAAVTTSQTFTAGNTATIASSAISITEA
jgi:hypothetical protein